MTIYNAMVIPKIGNAVLKAYKDSWPRDVIRMHICSSLDFHAQTMNWDCGYRNMQSMLSSYLSHDSGVRDQLFSSGIISIPTLKDLQKIIENAWKKGYDRIGGMQLEYSLFGTTKWIGATEVVAMLRSCKIRACVADFDFTGGICDLNTMIQVIWEYFSSRCKNKNINNSTWPKSYTIPLYLQHQGHSRLILGVEKWISGEIKLLILDPQMKRAIQFHQREGDEANILRQSISTHGLSSKSKYQIAYLSQQSLYKKEKENSKIIVDELRHPKLKFI
jgi:hypothetical protein|mmetsp:Transcript_6395/g.10185  ORF Transcript_6395/g.10185 Transcript_6395/m.10185 type:complete len:276 (-) Transcript_6395:58-885(-)